MLTKGYESTNSVPQILLLVRIIVYVKRQQHRT